MKVRRAEARDIPAVVALQGQYLALLERFAGLRKGGLRSSMEKDGQLYRARLDDEEAHFSVVEEGRQVVGYVLATLEAAPGDLVEPPWVSLDELVVEEAHRGRGAGRALVQAAEEWGRSRKATAVQLAVHEGNEGTIAAYRALGFNVTMRQMTKRL